MYKDRCLFSRCGPDRTDLPESHVSGPRAGPDSRRRTSSEQQKQQQQQQELQQDQLQKLPQQQQQQPHLQRCHRQQQWQHRYPRPQPIGQLHKVKDEISSLGRPCGAVCRAGTARWWRRSGERRRPRKRGEHGAVQVPPQRWSGCPAPDGHRMWPQVAASNHQVDPDRPE